MAIISELRILLRVITAGQSELAKMEAGLLGIDAAGKKVAITQQQLNTLQTASINAQSKAAAAANNVSKVIANGKQAELVAQKELNTAYATQALNADKSAKTILSAQNAVKNSRDALKIAQMNYDQVTSRSFKDAEAQKLAEARAALQLQKATQDEKAALPALQAARNTAANQAIRDAERVTAAQGNVAKVALTNAQAEVNATNTAASAALTAQKAVQAYDDAVKKAASGPSFLEKVAAGARTVANDLGRLATVGAVALGGLLAATTVIGLEFDTMKQKATASFTALLGSAPQAKAFLSDLFGFTRQTALGFQEVITAAQEFRARGFQIGEIIPTLKAVGDQAAALSKPISESMKVISFNLGQIHSSAILQQRDVRDLANAGVKAWEYLADAAFKAGKISTNSVQELRQAITSHRVELTGAFAFSAITQGMERDFNGMLQIQSRTFAGMIAVGRRTFSELAGIFAQPLFEKLNSGLANFDNALKSAKVRETIASWGQEFTGFITAFTQGFVHGIIPALQWIINNKAALIGTVVALGLAFAWVHPVIAALAALGGAIALFGLMKTNSSDLGNNMLKVQEAVLKARINIEQYVANLKSIGTSILNFRFNYEDNYTLKDLLGDLAKVTEKVWNITLKFDIGGKGGGGFKIGDVLKTFALTSIPGLSPGLSLLFGGSGANGANNLTNTRIDQMTAAQAKLFGAQNLENARKHPQQLSPEDLLDQEKWAQINLDYKTATESASEAAAAAKSVGERAGEAFDAINTVISKTFAGPTQEMAQAQLSLDQATQSLHSYSAGVIQQSYDLDQASRAIDRNRYALGLQMDKLDEQSYGLSERSYGLQQQIAAIQRANRPAAANAAEAQINALQDQIALIDTQQHGIDQQKHRLELLDKAEQQRQHAIDEAKQKIQDETGKRQLLVDQIQAEINRYTDLHRIQQDNVELAKNLPTEEVLNAFVTGSLIPFVKAASQQLVDISGGVMNSILSKPIDDVGTKFNELAVDQIPAIQTALANLASMLSGNPLQARASGGQIIAGVPYLFGEKGPEIGVFGQNGYMYANGQGPTMNNSKRVVNLAPITINQYIGHSNKSPDIDMFKRIV